MYVQQFSIIYAHSKTICGMARGVGRRGKGGVEVLCVKLVDII